jgi:DNA-directed RNA polymerase specialized sigma24 family protein
VPAEDQLPPIEQLQRLPEIHVENLLRQGIFTTGLLLEVSETTTRRQYLADQIGATTGDVNAWRDEALLLNLANFTPDEQVLFTQARLVGLSDVLALPLDEFRHRLHRAARALDREPPDDLMVEGWWEQAQTLHEE